MDNTQRDRLRAAAARVREVFVPYERTEKAQDAIAELHFRDNSGSEGGVMTLLGEAGSGKTKILRDYKGKYPDVKDGIRKPNGEFSDKKEVLLVQMPNGSDKNFLEVIYASLCNINVDDLTSKDITQFNYSSKIYPVAKEVGLKIILIEETHQIFESTANNISKTATVLKDLTNRSLFSIVISGTPETQRLLDRSSELSRRVHYEFELKPLKWELKQDAEMVREVFDGLDEYLSDEVFGCRSGLAKAEIAKPLIRAGLGHIGNAALLIEKAGKAAVDDMLQGKAKCITLQHLANAFYETALWRRFPDGTTPFPLNDRGELLDLLDNPLTRMRGRTRLTNRDVEFKR